VVAYAGPVIQARRALNVLAAISSRPNLTLADIRQELDAIDPDRINELQLIGEIITDVRGTTITSSRFVMRVPATEVPGLGTVYAAGTGKGEFVRLLSETDWTMNGGANEFQVAHAIVGALVNKEYRQGGTIEDRWGGGFEAVIFASGPGRFQKVGDILHTFWIVDTSSPDKAQLVPWFYKTTYWKDALIIRYASFDKNTDGTYQLKMNSLELIPPLLRDVKNYDLAELGAVDFSYKALCCHVSIQRPGSRDVMHIIKPPRPGAILELEFQDNNSSGRLHIPGELSRMVIEEARARALRS